MNDVTHDDVLGIGWIACHQGQIPCSTPSQSGLINVNAPIETWNSHGPNYNKFLVMNGNSDVNILAPISLRYASAGYGDRGNLTLYMNTAGNMYVNAAISTNIPVSTSSTIPLTDGGSINLNSTAGSVYVNAAIDASGAVSTNNASSYSGRGGTISLTGGGGITVNNTLTSLGRTGGNLTFSTGNNVITTGNGANDGIKQLMKGGNFSKSGTGTLQLSAANQIADLFLYSGTLQAGSATAIPSYSNLYFSGGNFHGQPLALALDFLGIALSELGSISERRTYQLISGLRNLPAFLVNDPGLNSGFMIPQYTAASIASQNKQLATPASIDSIVSSNGQEDHVSMGANAATKTLRIVENVERILAIELLNGSQALEFRRPLKSSEFIESFVKSYREEVPFVSEDRILHYDIEKSVSFLNSFQIEMED